MKYGALSTRNIDRTVGARSERKRVTTRTSCRVSALDRSKDRQKQGPGEGLEKPGGAAAIARNLESTICREGVLFQVHIHLDQVRQKGVNGEATCL